MNPLKRIRRFAAVLPGMAGALVAFGATPAFAVHVPPPGSGSGVSTSPVGTINGNAPTGYVQTTDFPAADDPDSTDVLDLSLIHI